MDRRFSIPYFITLAGIPVAACLRIWSLNTAVDNLGMPVMHRSIYALIAAAGLYLLLALLCAMRSSCRETGPGALIYGRGGWICGALASGMILLGAAAEFWESLVAGPGISAPIMLLLGLLGGICALITVLHRRRNGARYPAAEIIPVVYLLVKTMLNFKHWSTDPVILDYCVQLFALIFAMLAFFRGAGFVLDQGKPRRTLFNCMAAVFFGAAAMMDGIHALSLSAIVTYGGFLLWQLPVIWDLQAGHGPVPGDSK